VFQKFITADSWALPGTPSGKSLEKLRSETKVMIKELPSLFSKATNIRVPGPRDRLVDFFSTGASKEAWLKLKGGMWYLSSNFDMFYDILGFYMMSSGINDVAVVQPSWHFDILFPGKSFLDFSKFLVPLCVNNDHWVLFFVDKQKTSIRFFDSLGTAPPEKAATDRVHYLFNYFGEDLSKYTVETVATFKKDNGSDCGPFAVAFSFFLAAGMAFSPTFFQPPGNVRLFCTRLLYETVLAYVTWSEQGNIIESGYEPEKEETTSAVTDADVLDAGDEAVGSLDDTGI
jgi:hypothetical protein